ncbi:PREDICTED: MHC class II transactivator-like [Thamnophis sirtalis]|uniref:MHC class II transactivator-like n=1 Tax=Thamnophis sirtalis TaxID=35019 RepID=A0A6I9X0K6_9SAUR|nr:PREDICTED: MHC class II transactivator-like [Thamnophis sirtalis]
MDLFKQILPEVREVLLTASAPQLQTFLDSMLSEGILSREYYQTLLDEKDTDDLARKLALTLLGKRAGPSDPHSRLPPLQLSGNARGPAKNGAVSLRTRNWTAAPAPDEVSPGGIPPETPCLQSEAHPASMDEMEEAPAVQVSEAASDDQDNPEVFYTVERDESGEVLSLCADMGEAYDKIGILSRAVGLYVPNFVKVKGEGNVGASPRIGGCIKRCMNEGMISLLQLAKRFGGIM